ncbi:MAG: hypothetical protein WCI93_01555 [bacterium]
MFRYLTATILIGVSIAGFLKFTNPLLADITKIKTEIASYNEALDNSKSLESERDKLTKKYNAIDPENLAKLQKLLPDNVDNIRLILEIEKIASPYGMVLKDVKYDASQAQADTKGTIAKTTDTTDATTAQPKVANTPPTKSKEYGIWNLEFSTEGTYSNFINFTKDLESNLRIVDISSIAFSSDSSSILGKTKPSDSYKYNFKIKTYWLKN